MSTLEIENIKLDKDQDLIFCTVGLYKMFLAHGTTGLLSKQVYDHLIFTARLQETNQVRATDGYIKNGLNIGNTKLKTAKSFLHEKGLIEYVQGKPVKGKPTYKPVYIKLNFVTTTPKVTGSSEIDPPVETGGRISAPPVDSTTCDSKQTLELRKLNALKEKEKEEENSENTSSDLPMNENYEKKDSSSSDSLHTEKTEEETSAEIRRDIYIETVRQINFDNPEWKPKLIYESVKKTFDKLWDSGKLDMRYLLYVAKEDGETARDFHAALKEGWYWESWKDREEWEAVTHEGNIRYDMEIEKIDNTREEWEAKYRDRYDEHVDIMVCPICGSMRAYTDYCDCGHVQGDSSKWIYTEQLCEVLSSENMVKGMLTEYPLQEYWQVMCKKTFPEVWKELEPMVREAEKQAVPVNKEAEKDLVTV